MSPHPEQWNQIQSAILSHRVPQAMLLVGPLHCSLGEFAIKIIQLLFCRAQLDRPCYECLDCRMVGNYQHPDIHWIRPEHPGGTIKIDQIRELQNAAYLTPKRADNKVIVINPSDKLNHASSNALLKILEEPPAQSIFILIAEQLSTLLPTILSRCFIYRFSDSQGFNPLNLILSGANYQHDAGRAAVISDVEVILDRLIELRTGLACPIQSAEMMSGYELESLFWLLYLVYSQVLYIHYGSSFNMTTSSKKLSILANSLNPLIIIRQIDKINDYLRKVSHNMNSNTTLVLEDLLIDLARESSRDLRQ